MGRQASVLNLNFLTSIAPINIAPATHVRAAFRGERGVAICSVTVSARCRQAAFGNRRLSALQISAVKFSIYEAVGIQYSNCLRVYL